MLVVGLLLSSTACNQKVYSVKVYGLKTCGSCSVLIDDFKKDDNIQLHVYDLDAHIKEYQKDIRLYKNVPENKAPVIITSSFVKVGYKTDDYQELKNAILTNKKPNKKDYYKRR